MRAEAASTTAIVTQTLPVVASMPDCSANAILKGQDGPEYTILQPPRPHKAHLTLHPRTKSLPTFPRS
eukprot:1095173-Amphidinium_carterae.1